MKIIELLKEFNSYERWQVSSGIRLLERIIMN
jgi:hypothetical protein